MKKSSEVEKFQAQLLDIENKIEDANQRLISLNERLAKLQSEKTLLIERQKYEVASEKVDENLLRLKEEENSLQKEVSLMKEEIYSLKEESKSVKKEISSVDEKTSLFGFQYHKFQKEKEELAKKVFSLQNEIAILENTIENDPGLSYAVKNILNHPRLKGIHNTIGKLITVDEQYSTAIDVALGSSANFLVVESTKCAEEAIIFLKENKLGRATFFPLDVITSRYLPNTILEMVQKENGFVGVASDLVKTDAIYQNILENQLGNVLVVKDMASLERIGHLLNYKYRIVTLDGELSHAGGSLTGGSLKKSTSILQMKIDVEEKKKDLENTKSALQKYEEKEVEYRNEQEVNEEIQRKNLLKEQMLNENILNKERRLTEVEKKLEEVSKQISGASSIKSGSLEESLLGIMKTITEVEVDKEIVSKRIHELKTEKSEISSQIAGIELENKKFSSSLYQVEQALKNESVTLGKMDTKMDYLLSVLSENYHLTYEKARMEYFLEIDPELARMKVNSLRKEMRDLGTVNLGSIEEFERVNTRYEFLNNQKTDLTTACEDLLKIIAEMDEIMVERLKEAFDKIQKEFSLVFHKMFKGGTGKLVLTDPDNILETGIDIVAEPPGKKLNNIQLLSGGEKTLTAISLLFAILNVYPVPFCILDEVEAALDEANVDTFGKYLVSQKEKSEFILITHKKRTMEYADTLYGITMQEQGVSKVVSVKLEGDQKDEK